MLENTFVHVPGIGPQTERSLWKQGILTWRDALECACPVGFSEDRWSGSCEQIEQSQRCLDRLDHRYFARVLAASEQWRAWRVFRRKVAYLDIETTGCSGNARVTVVGIYDGVRTSSFVAGDNLDQFPEVVEQYAMLVTFNGSSFDLPFLRRRFPDLHFHQLHMDLMHTLRRLGLQGGLKAIEREVGIERDDDLAHLGGWDAVRLWNEYRAGREASLETLIRYNAADIENLEHLAELAFGRLIGSAGLPTGDQMRIGALE